MDPKVQGGRFAIAERVGSGGSGDVYRATDVTTGELVALKVLRDATGDARKRLMREVRVLEEVRHPRIVRYVAHGVLDDGKPYLAMEWVNGETLAQSLARTSLSAADAIALAANLADALAALHTRGLVHRDVKPGNVLLRNGTLEGATLADLGLVRASGDATITGAGTIIGTPAYMAPEQARGEHDVGPAADVFALGCVLFRSITGQNAFHAKDALAALAKVLLDDPPNPSDFVPELDERVDALVARMLAKDPARRLPDGDAAARALRDLGTLRAGPPSTERYGRLGLNERRLHTIVLAATRVDPEATIVGTDDMVPAIRRVTARFDGARCEVLRSGAVVVTMLGDDSARERAVKAAACALDLCRLFAVPIAITTGHTVVVHEGTAQPASDTTDVFDRAAALLHDAKGAPVILVDDTTEALVSDRFVIGAGRELVSTKDEDARGTLLGRPTAFVGRERELVTLQALYEECEREGVSRVAVVTGPPGVGKSRLRRELLATLRGHGKRFLLLAGAGDLHRRGAPLAPLASALFELAGVIPDDDDAARADKVAARVRSSVRAEDVVRVTEFLLELCGLASAPPSSHGLAARADPVLMHEHVRRAFVDFIAAEAARAPVALVLDDVQWLDPLTPRLVEATLAALADAPLLVLGFARPEVNDAFPGLWASRSVVPMTLEGLSKRAAERLVRGALSDPGQDIVDRVVSRGGGNPLLLEELVRAEDAGRGANPPATVLAMIEARLERLDGQTRRVLRAASVFGLAFTTAGLGAVLADAIDADLAGRVDHLVASEIVVRAEHGFAFRDALVHDVAYRMLTTEDARLAHRYAAEHLEERAADPVVLAEHWTRSDRPERALEPLIRSAQVALDASDFAGALAFAKRARAIGGSAVCALVEAEAHRWMGDIAKSHAAALEAAADHGEPHHLAALRALAFSASHLGAWDELDRVRAELMAYTLDSALARAFVLAASQTATSLAIVGKLSAARGLVLRAQPYVGDDPALLGRFLEAKVAIAAHAGELSELVVLTTRARENARNAGDDRAANVYSINIGFAWMQLGEHERALEWLDRARDDAAAHGWVPNRRYAMQNAGYVLLQMGRTAEARAVERAVLDEIGGEPARVATNARACLSTIELAEGNAASALEHAETALAHATGAPQTAYAETVLAEALLALGDAGPALEHGQHALAIIAQSGGRHFAEARARLVVARALRASNRDDEALRAITVARDAVLAHAALLPSDRAKTFLERVGANAATIDLAQRWSSRT